MPRTPLHSYCDEARELARAGAHAQAIAICRHILQRYPKHIETYRVIGEAYLQAGDFRAATDIFRRLLLTDPEYPFTYVGLALSYEAQGDIHEAVSQMERAFELAPNMPEIWDELRRLLEQRDGQAPPKMKLSRAALARRYMLSEQYQSALTELRDLVEQEPERMDLQVMFAEALWRDNARERAADLCRDILEKCPLCLKALLILGEILYSKGEFTAAQAVWARTHPLDPENRVANALFGARSPLPLTEIEIPRLEWKEPAPQPSPPPELRVEAPASLAQGLEPLFTEAVAVERVTEEPAERLETIPSVPPEPVEETPPSLADIYLLKLQENPKDNETRLALARFYRDEGRLSDALTEYRSVAYPTSGQMDAVIADLEALAEAQPENLEVKELLADVYARAGQLQRALDLYRWLQARVD